MKQAFEWETQNSNASNQAEIKCVLAPFPNATQG